MGSNAFMAKDLLANILRGILELMILDLDTTSAFSQSNNHLGQNEAVFLAGFVCLNVPFQLFCKCRAASELNILRHFVACCLLYFVNKVNISPPG